MNSAMDWAQAYMSKGWHPIPMHPKEKRPAVKWAHLAEQDCLLPSLPRSQFLLENPGAGLGILLRPSGLLVVDCDSAAAVGEAIHLTAELGDPVCNNIVMTNKGAHFYYRRPAHCPPLRAIHRGGSQAIDIMADGYMMAPPSVHPSGHRYSWHSTGPLQDAPAWAVGFLLSIRERSIAHTQLSPEGVAGAFPSTPGEAADLAAAVLAYDPYIGAFLTCPPHLQASLPAVKDRSTLVWRTINTLIRVLGAGPGPFNAQRERLKKTIGPLTDESIAKVVWFGALGCDLVGQKPREKGWAWFCDEIARARLEVVPGAV